MKLRPSLQIEQKLKDNKGILRATTFDSLNEMKQFLENHVLLNSSKMKIDNLNGSTD